MRLGKEGGVGLETIISSFVELMEQVAGMRQTEEPIDYYVEIGRFG